MKQSLVIGLIVLSLTLSASSLVFAQSGYVFVGTDFHGVNVSDPPHPLVAAEYRLTDHLAVGGVIYPGETWFDLGVRYGVGSGVYGKAYFDSGEFDCWAVGGFVERHYSERLAFRTLIGVLRYPESDVIVPDAVVEIKYDLDGPWTIMGSVTYPIASVGVGYEF